MQRPAAPHGHARHMGFSRSTSTQRQESGNGRYRTAQAVHAPDLRVALGGCGRAGLGDLHEAGWWETAVDAARSPGVHAEVHGLANTSAARPTWGARVQGGACTAACGVMRTHAGTTASVRSGRSVMGSNAFGDAVAWNVPGGCKRRVAPCVQRSRWLLDTRCRRHGRRRAPGPPMTLAQAWGARLNKPIIANSTTAPITP